MSPSEPKRKLDDVLAGAVNLRPQPDFARWHQEHPEAIAALRALPTLKAQRRITMIRIVRYSTSVAAVVLLLAAGAWWMLFSHGVESSWAQAIDQLAQIRSAICTLSVHRAEIDQVQKIFLEGARVRIEDSHRIYVFDFRRGKVLLVMPTEKTAILEDMLKRSGGQVILGSNPLTDLVRMKDASAERLPDEKVGDTPCQVYRVKDTAFMGFKVPWVKLWLDSRSNLPLQVHSLMADGQLTWTFHDFHWNAPFDKNLLELVAPQGYKLVEEDKLREAASTATADSGNAGVAQDGAKAEEGREIPGDEIAKTLDMLGERIEANYKAIHTWSGTFDLVERYRFTNLNSPRYESLSHAVGAFFAEPGRDRIRIDYRDVEPLRIIGGNAKPAEPAPQQSHWIRTPEHLLHVSLTKLQHNVEGFPRIEGVSQPFRVLYREPPNAYHNCLQLLHSNPLFFFGDGGRPSWDLCCMYAGVLRGEKGPEQRKQAEKIMRLRKRRQGADTEYVVAFLGYGRMSHEDVFSSAAGFNLVSETILTQGQPYQTRQYTFRKQSGVFIPTKFEFKMFEDRNTKDSTPTPTQHHVCTLMMSQVNEPIDPAVFEIPSLGLRSGDRMVDRIENRMEVFDGKQFVPADKFKLQPVAQMTYEASQRNQSTNNLKMIALAILNYEQANGAFPPAYKADKDGKPLLSWRVLILPYLEENELYTQFHLDEPWDSQHNKPLIARMPQVYRSPGSKVSDAGKTNYLTVRGEETVFPANRAISFADIRDGTSNTIMAVEASDDKAVIWTKPDDFEYGQQDPMKGLVGLWPDGFVAAMADGSVRFVWSSIDPAVLKAFFTRNGGEKVGPEALRK